MRRYGFENAGGAAAAAVLDARRLFPQVT